LWLLFEIILTLSCHGLIYPVAIGKMRIGHSSGYMNESVNWTQGYFGMSADRSRDCLERFLHHGEQFGEEHKRSRDRGACGLYQWPFSAGNLDNPCHVAARLWGLQLSFNGWNMRSWYALSLAERDTPLKLSHLCRYRFLL
jgi:hypothetical protein